jgi:hypothetical protein
LNEQIRGLFHLVGLSFAMSVAHCPFREDRLSRRGTTTLAHRFADGGAADVEYRLGRPKSLLDGLGDMGIGLRILVWLIPMLSNNALITAACCSYRTSAMGLGCFGRFYTARVKSGPAGSARLCLNRKADMPMLIAGIGSKYLVYGAV